MTQLTFGSFGSAQAVTTSDTTPVTCRAIYVGGAGNVAVKTSASATAVTFTAPPVGSILPILIDGGQIMATNTTATLLVALA
jgi:hypothetical protein